MERSIGDLHIIAGPLERAEQVAVAFRAHKPVITVGGEVLEKFEIVPHTTGEICPVCKEALEKYEAKNGSRFVARFVRQTETVPVTLPVRPFALVLGPQYE